MKLGEERARLLSAEQLDRLRVVLVATRNPLNIGAVARAMSNFGFARLRVVNPYDVAFREARSAVGASDLLANAEQYDSVADAVADCTLVIGTTAARYRELRQPLHDLPDSGPAIHKGLASGQVAILFGSEKRGLANEDLSHCDWLLRIPTSECNVSMNLGQAVAICLYEIVRESGSLATVGNERTTAGNLERMTQTMLEVLVACGYVKRISPAAEEKVRRLVHRAEFQADDAEVWLGMLRKISWRLHAREAETRAGAVQKGDAISK